MANIARAASLTEHSVAAETSGDGGEEPATAADTTRVVSEPPRLAAASSLDELEPAAVLTAIPIAAQGDAADTTMEPATPVDELAPEPVAELAPAEDADDRPDDDGNYLLRITAFVDFSLLHQGLYFSPIVRKIPHLQVIPVGRYTEKNRAAAHAAAGLSEAVVFKLKVVLRTHAQFYTDAEGQWWIKDLGLSSGTFLNHVRLLAASKLSPGTQLHDGDIMQLGMDYRGGSEEIFRCVKMRIELNRLWQRKANAFNLEAHSRLKQLTLGDNEEGEDHQCAICLDNIEPCQAVFISPCLHLWHYRCIRQILAKCYPQFYCPNCRSMCDLEADDEI